MKTNKKLVKVLKILLIIIVAVCLFAAGFLPAKL